MSEESDKLNKIAEYLRRINSKVLLLRLINQAKAEYDKYDYKAGKQSLLKALKLNDKNPLVYRGLGCVEQFSGNYDKAEEYFNLALKYSDNKEIEYTLIGMVYYIQNKLEEAVEYFNEAINCNDNYISAYDARNQAMLEHHLNILDLQESFEKSFKLM